MQQILDEIKQIKAVIGSYVHINGVNETHSDLPKIFLSKTKNIGQAIDRVIKINNATRMQATSIEMKFGETALYTRQIDHDASLIIFCDPEVNRKLLNMTTGMLTNELQEAVNNIRRGKKPPAAPKPTAAQSVTEPIATPQPVPELIDVNQILHAGSLSAVFKGIQEGLALAIGPISDMVMRDCVESWARNGEIDESRLGELVNTLCGEIDESGMEDEFKAYIAQFLP